MQGKVFEMIVSNKMQLKRIITTEISSFTQQMLNNALENLVNQFHTIIRESSGQTKHL